MTGAARSGGAPVQPVEIEQPGGMKQGAPGR